MLLLKITDLKKRYISPEGEAHLIVGVSSFQMAEGEHVVIKGLSGEGKTTFLNLIAGIIRPDAGSITIEGQDICQYSESKRDSFRCQYIGYIFQTFNLLQGYTAFENVILGMMFNAKTDKAWAKELLSKVGLHNRMNYLPRQLSVGQQQRVVIARALANHPKLVLADEPTGNLDPKHSHEVVELIRNICREYKASLLLVTHDPAVVAKFDRVEDLVDINKR